MSATNDLLDKPVGRLLVKYSIPTVTAMVVNAIYNVVDRMFIGTYVGTDALGGLTLAFPIMMLIFAFGSLIGIGGSTLMSIRLGEGNKKSAELIAGNMTTYAFILYIGILVLLLPNITFLLNVFGGSEALTPYAEQYLDIILVGFFFQMYGFAFSNMIRVQDKPYLPMIMMLISAGTNIVLDYVFIVIFGWGVQGAAIATVIGQSAGFFIAVASILHNDDLIKIRFKNLVPKIRIALDIFSIGFATFVGTLGTSIAMLFLNTSLNTYGGNAAVAAMGAINSIFTMYIMPISGIQQAMQPIIGYNYGAKKLDRVFRTLKLSVVASVIFSTILFIILELKAPFFISIFISDENIIPYAARGLRIFIAMMPIISINLFGIAFFQSTNQGVKSMWLSMLRQFIILIPLIYILPPVLGLDGVWLASPIADFLSTTIIAVILLKEIIQYKRGEGKYAIV